MILRQSVLNSLAMKSIRTGNDFDLVRLQLTKNLGLVSSGLNAIVVLFSIMDLCAVLKSLHTLGISMTME